MAKFEIKVNKQEYKMYGEKKYFLLYGGVTMFSFVNRFKGKWLFYNVRGEKPFAIVDSESVPTESITNLAVAYGTIHNGGVVPTDTNLYGEKITINRKAEDYPED